jgi:hypothetical protein
MQIPPDGVIDRAIHHQEDSTNDFEMIEPRHRLQRERWR